MGEGRPLFGQKRDGSRFMVEVVSDRSHWTLGSPWQSCSDRSDRTAQTADLEAGEKVLMRELGHQEIVAREMGHRVKSSPGKSNTIEPDVSTTTSSKGYGTVLVSALCGR